MSDKPSFIDQIRKHAERIPDAEAIAASGRKPLRYARLWSWITEIAANLQHVGLSGDKSIALALEDGPELAGLFPAVASVARCTVLDPSSRHAEFEFFISNSNAQALIVSPNTSSAAAESAKRMNIPVLEITSAEGEEAGIFVRKGWDNFSHHRSVREEAGVVRSYVSSPSVRTGADVALEIYTSGTTAKPKPIFLTHDMLNANLLNLQRALSLSQSDRCLNAMPMFHVHGLLITTASTLFSGGCVICSAGFSAEHFVDWIQEISPTWYSASPAIHAAVVEEATGRKINHSLRFIRSSASALPQQTMRQMEQIFRVPVIEGYGMTECPLITSNLAERRKSGSVGLPAGPELKIVDGQGDALQPGETGEIMIRGSCVSAQSNDWLRTGDSGYQDQDGFLFLTGRLKEMINRGGQKISPMEVDSVLLEHPAVAEAACFGFKHDKLGEDIAAAVVLRKNHEATEREIRDFARVRLVDYKIPRQIVFLDELPRNRSRKVMRAQLARDLDAAKPFEGEQSEKPSNNVERKLAELWCDVLELPSVGRQDDFFRLGGDSLRATRLMSRIRKIFNVQLPLRSLFEAPTLAEISAMIQNEEILKVETHTAVHCEANAAHVVAQLKSKQAEKSTRTVKEMDFSLFFFSADGSTSSTNKYRLLLESARFADEHDFAAIWVPERHFHPFGGLYPNPSVIGAALAAITKRLRIRAGSVVVPLQHPVRVAEEWAVVDNLSGGRVEISCASGWHTNDFVLSPQTYQDRREVMFERLDIIQKLWRGETILQPNGTGNLVEVAIYPKPLQPELPVWLSCHSDETFRKAGVMGVNVITTLYNTTIERVAEQIDLYNRSLIDNGHDRKQKTVSIMLHTFIDESDEIVLQKVRSAYSEYLLTFLGLQKDQAKGKSDEFHLTDSDQKFLLERAIDRLYEIRDLVGTPERCFQKVKQFHSMGIDEIACLIDFGIDTDSVLLALNHLNRLRILVQQAEQGNSDNGSHSGN